jgi:hypothetical protein
MLSKVELARKAGLAALTVSRIENGGKCRLETKGKILAALGLSVGEKEKVFPESDDQDSECLRSARLASFLITTQTSELFSVGAFKSSCDGDVFGRWFYRQMESGQYSSILRAVVSWQVAGH